MALALYRKYRPARFADVVGQEHVTEPLRIALAAGRINHAYLFSGPRGCGKTSSARILARSLNCLRGPTPDPCGVCNSCVALAPEGSGNIDVIELDAASHGGVDDARELRDRAFYAPAESRYRVFIVDEAHMVTTQGFNALLKIVEEPPEHLVFVFATTEPDKVLPTIRSRTHHYPFRLIPPGTLRALLERICADEGVTVAAPVLPLVIRAGGGSARDSLSVLDQLLAGAGPEGVTYERAVALLGVTDVALIDDTVDALAALDGAAVFEAVDRLVEAGHDPRRFAADLLERLRDLMLIQAVPDAGARGLVNAPGDEISRMADQAARLGAATLTRHAEILNTGLTEMRGTTAPRLLLELLCGRMLLPAASLDDSALLQRLERMERRLEIAAIAPPDERPRSAEPTSDGRDAGSPRTIGGSGTGAAAEPTRTGDRNRPAPERPDRLASTGRDPVVTSLPAPAASAGRVPERSAERGAADGRPARSAERDAGSAGTRSGVAPTPALRSDASARADGAPVGGGLDAAAVRRVWPEVLSAAKEGSRSTGAMLMNAVVRSLDGDSLVLTINSAPLARRLSEARNTEVIAAALRRVLGVDWQVRCEHQDGASGSIGVGSSGAFGARPTAGGSALGVQTGGGPASGSAAGGPSGGPRGGSTAGQSAASGPSNGGPTHGGPSNAGPPSGGGRRPGQPEGTPPVYSRRTAVATSPPSVPLPPEPPPEDEEDEEMLAEANASSAAGVGQPPPRRDPEEVAIELLAAQLGARAVDDIR